MKKIYLFIIAAFFSSLSWGQAFPEDFNYVTGTNVTANGWTQITAGSGPLTINSNGLSYPNSPSSGIGFGVNVLPGMQVIGRSGGSISTTAYMSFFINLSSAGTTTGGVNIAGIMSGSFPSPGVAARVFTRQSGTGFNFGISKTGLTPVTWDAAVRTLNTTYLVVLKYTFNAGTTTDDIVSMWVNPVLGAAETAPLLTMGSTIADATTALFGPTINPRSGTAAPSFEIDAIRYGATWDIVTPAIVPTLTVTPSTPLVIGAVPINTTSPSVFFNLSGVFLTPAPGTITVTSPNAAFQVSNDNITFGSSTTIANATATLAATPVYVRFMSATAGAATVNLTISGGGVAVPPTVTVNASAATPYFSKTTGSLHVVGTWGTAGDGTGTAPIDFVTDNQIFTITNRTDYELDDNFQVFGIGSKIVLGNGTDTINLKLPILYTILNDADHKVDISNKARLEVANKIMRPSTTNPYPFFGTVATNSTVEYTFNGTTSADTVRIPPETFGNLKLVNGLKYFSFNSGSNFAFVNGNLDIINVESINGTGNGSSSVLVRGNVTMSNSFFETGAIADANRMNLNMGGQSGTQTISGSPFYIGQLRTQAVSATVPAFPLNIVLAPGTNIITGTTTGGGINLQQATHNLSLNGNTLTMNNGSSFVPFTSAAAPGHLGTISGTATSNLIIDKTMGSAPVGTLRFAAGGEMLNNFTFNSVSGTNNNLNLNNPLTVNGVLSLNTGNILLGSNTLTAAGTITGASLAGHIVTNSTGALKINNVGATSTIFPVGPSTTTLYHPATITNTGTSDNFSVNVVSAAPTCGDPTASVTATWNITEQTVGGSNCTIALDYTGSATGVTYSAVSAKVVDCGGAGPFYNNGSVTGSIATGTGFTSFSPFGITSNITVLPVTLINFSGNRIGNVNKLTWTTTREQNNLGFEVQRSLDGQNFTSIGFVNTQASSGNTINNINYYFTDANINVGMVQYYRLRQIDINNQSKYSVIVKIKGEQATVLTIDGIAPNPVQNSLTINISSPNKSIVNLFVMDIKGRIIQQQKVTIQEGTNVIPMDVSLLGNGIYLLKAIYSNNNQISIAKFIKQ